MRCARRELPPLRGGGAPRDARPALDAAATRGARQGAGRSARRARGDRGRAAARGAAPLAARGERRGDGLGAAGAGSAARTDVTIVMTTGTVTSAAAARAAPAGARARRPGAAPLRAARRAGLGGALPRSLAAGRGRVRGKRAVAEPARCLPGAAYSAGAGECPHVGAQLRTMATLLPGLARGMLGAFDLVQAQSEEDGERLRLLGARDVTAPGNLKFAAPPLPADAAELARLRHAPGRPPGLARGQHASRRGARSWPPPMRGSRRSGRAC